MSQLPNALPGWTLACWTSLFPSESAWWTGWWGSTGSPRSNPGSFFPRPRGPIWTTRRTARTCGRRSSSWPGWRRQCTGWWSAGWPAGLEPPSSRFCIYLLLTTESRVTRRYLNWLNHKCVFLSSSLWYFLTHTWKGEGGGTDGQNRPATKLGRFAASKRIVTTPKDNILRRRFFFEVIVKLIRDFNSTWTKFTFRHFSLRLLICLECWVKRFAFAQ